MCDHEHMEARIEASLRFCLHVTSAAALPSILQHGLIAAVGPLSAQVEESPGIFMFPSWEDMEGAGWLFDEAWPHETEPVLLGVHTEGLDLDSEAGFEVVTRTNVASDRILVLAPTELNWGSCKDQFRALGGLMKSPAVALKPRRNSMR